MFEQGIIELSYSSWASLMVLVKKKDGSFHYCMDYMHLNAVTHKGIYPLPSIKMLGSQDCVTSN